MSIKNRAAKVRRHKRVCEGKVRHPDRSSALTALLSLRRNRGAVTSQLGVYRCLACSTWHFGHRPR